MDSHVDRPAGSEIDHNSKNEKLWNLMSTYMSNGILNTLIIDIDTHAIKRSIVNHVEYTLACTRFNLDKVKCLQATAHSVHDRLIEDLNDTMNYFDEQDVKSVNYMSLEFLMGRSLQNSLINMNVEDNYRQALKDLGFNIEELYDLENDAALGNGGLGRLAACFLDSMATLNLPAWGYGLRYTYGMFKQTISNGWQCEQPDDWLELGNPWEIERLDVRYPVRFYGNLRKEYIDGKEMVFWEGGQMVQAVAYDTPIPGYKTHNCNNLRLWRAIPLNDLDLTSFNTGDYTKALEGQRIAETLTSVLYPDDSTQTGRELRIRQQYLFVSATIQDVITRFKRRHKNFDELPNKISIQLNDTHPSLGIPEMMRILMDEEGLNWDQAWNITTKTFSYTNHTILPEALESWPCSVIESILPRHYDIIMKINWLFLAEVNKHFQGTTDVMERLRVMSLTSEDYEKRIRMANLSIVGSHTVNGVAEIHSEILKRKTFKYFYEMTPDKFQNKTNGVTQRRWMLLSNPEMSKLITSALGTDDWVKNLDLLAGLRDVADNQEFQNKWHEVKYQNKVKLANYIKESQGITIDPHAMFDVHVKRIHEYKRQLMNCLYCISRYHIIKGLKPEMRGHVVKRVTIFGGKAAPAYSFAKKVIKLIHTVADLVNNDPEIGDLYKIVFLPNYGVKLAEMIIPASDLSQHISTAGTEASGTSNMKFAMNGCLIIGTMDGANVEIADCIGKENIFIFGALADEVDGIRLNNYQNKGKRLPKPIGNALALVLGQLLAGSYGVGDEIDPFLHCLKGENDYYLLTTDFDSYVKAQEIADETYKDMNKWTRMSILSVAGMGKFSTDRTISEYANDIWHISECVRPDANANGGVTKMKRTRSIPHFDPDDELDGVTI